MIVVRRGDGKGTVIPCNCLRVGFWGDDRLESINPRLKFSKALDDVLHQADWQHKYIAALGAKVIQWGIVILIWLGVVRHALPLSGGASVWVGCPTRDI